ncbi:MAG: RNA polymerase sigma factor [Bryobacteraceae bacterium]|nr:RNA polymerase sigma factor [Bryobacteraceae bacterium]
MSVPIAGKPAAFAGDDELLAACRRGDVRAYEQLYASHAGRLKSIALHMLGNRQDAEDAVQETFLKVFRGVNGFQGQSAIGTWMCRILINTCYDALRKPRPDGENVTVDLVSKAPSAPLRVALDSALKKVSPNYRMVFWLFEVEGYRHSEVAQILQVPEGTSKAWLFEAKRELRRLLTEGGQ